MQVFFGSIHNSAWAGLYRAEVVDAIRARPLIISLLASIGRLGCNDEQIRLEKQRMAWWGMIEVYGSLEA